MIFTPFVKDVFGRGVEVGNSSSWWAYDGQTELVPDPPFCSFLDGFQIYHPAQPVAEKCPNPCPALTQEVARDL